MIKKFYYSCVSLKYSYFMFGLPLIIFTLAFMQTRRPNPALKVLMGVFTAVLAVVMVFYYRDKFRVSRSLKNVKNIREYEKGGMIDRSYILEDRILMCSALDVTEVRVNDILELKYDHDKYGKYYYQVTTKTGSLMMSALNQTEGRRFAAFLKKRIPGVRLVDVDPVGEGTLKELGA